MEKHKIENWTEVNLDSLNSAEKIFKELAEEGNPIAEANMDRIYAPVGLDIGAISPEEIALSIVAEIRTIFSQRDGAQLRTRLTPIHERE